MKIRMLLKIIRAFLRTIVSISLIFIAYISFSVRQQMGNVKEKLAQTPTSPIYLDRYGNEIYYQDGFKKFEFENSKTGIYEIDNQLESAKRTLILATLAAEDKRFFSHGGIDSSAIIRAFLNNQKNNRIVEGGSTITQQLARTAFEDVVGKEKTYIRKLKEAVASILIEKTLTKEEILENWYTWINFSPSNPGIINASESLFSKKPWELRTGQIALLVGLAQSPTKYDPLTYMENANQRKKTVLRRMLDLNFISEKEYEKELSRTLELKPLEKTFYATGFINSLKKNSELDTQEFPVINTTLDKDLQNNAYATVCFFANRIMNNESKDDFGDFEGMALISIDPKNGSVRSFVTSQYEIKNNLKDETDCLEEENLTSKGDWYDFSESYRSPGSSIKPFIFAVGIENGIDLNEKISDQKTLFWNDEDSSIYSPENHGKKYLKISDWINIFSNSSNTPFVYLLDGIGNETLSEYWEKMDFKKKWGPYLSSALGTTEVNLIELTSLFTTLSSYGEKKPLRWLDSTSSKKGEMLFKNNLDSKKVFQPNTARKVIYILGKALHSKESTGKNSIACEGLENEIPVIAGECLQEWFIKPNEAIGIERYSVFGKSGTSQNNRDGWFVGCIPELCTGIWIGTKDGKGNLAGGSYPALAFNMFMRLSAQSLSWATFEPPNNFEFEPKSLFSN